MKGKDKLDKGIADVCDEIAHLERLRTAYLTRGWDQRGGACGTAGIRKRQLDEMIAFAMRCRDILVTRRNNP